jgi:hypothetical protein
MGVSELRLSEVVENIVELAYKSLHRTIHSQFYPG